MKVMDETQMTQDQMTQESKDEAQCTQAVPKIKICGITTRQEAEWLNEAQADYAGFVFYEKSRRNINISDAAMIRRSLYPGIGTVAVTVDPTPQQLRMIEIGGFDILQVHGTLSLEVLRECRLPIWRAFNIETLADVVQTPDETPEEAAEREQLEDAKIEAYVLDGISYGSGRTFDWTDQSTAQIRALFGEKKLILAGGLNEDNVTEGIALFQPDVVDVSSGVERAYGSGKDEEKIRRFIRKVREQ